MNHLERRIPRGLHSLVTPVELLRAEVRGKVAVRVGGGGLVGGAGRVSRVATAGEQDDWGQIVAEQNVFQRPLRWKKARPELLYESDGKIECDAEVHEDYNGKGDLGIILQFAGIEFTKGPFQKSKHDRSGSPVFYLPVGHNERMVRLFLATRGDIFEFQIVPAQMDVSPFFQRELYLYQLIPQFTEIYNPNSMSVRQNHQVVTVSYNPLPTR